jgi:hypothetical protein
LSENIELDIIGNTDTGEPERLHLEYISDSNKIILEVYNINGEKILEKISFADKTIINFARSVEEIRRQNI